MIASLPMYDRPSNAAAHDRLWELIRDALRARGIKAPDALDRNVGYRASWAHRDLVLGHICNLPYRAEYRDCLTRIGTADYGLEGCEPGFYRSVLVVRHDDPRDRLSALANARYAANALHSHSGFAVTHDMAMAAGTALPAPLITGSHDGSVIAIAEGRADFATIDQQTWVMQRQDLPEAQALRVIGTSATSPGQSFVTQAGVDPAPYFDAIQSAIAGLDPADAERLGLRGIVRLPDSAFDLPLPNVYA